MSQGDLSPDDDPEREPTALGRLCERFGAGAGIGWNAVKIWSLRAVFVLLHAVVILAGFYAIVWWGSGGACYSNVEKIPPRLVGLVLGCVRKVGTYENLFFRNRVEAATALYRAGKVQYLIASGDNSNHGYDEPSDLKAALVAKGVPANRIYCDYAGFRTLDSVIRAKKVFGQDDFTVVSQRYHNERALYVARRSGMPDAVAFDAADVPGEWMIKPYIREAFARLKAVLDVEFLGTAPKFLGKRVAIGPRTPPVDAVPVPRFQAGE